jgi:hypothetical protein
MDSTRSTFRVLFYLKRDKQKANGEVPLFCRITVDGKETRFGMKCDVDPKYWDVKTGKATGRTTNTIWINALIDNTKAAIHKVYRDLQERDNYASAERVKNVFLGIEARQYTLLELFDSNNCGKKLQVGINLCYNTYQRYCSIRRILSEFIQYKYNRQDMYIREVNLQFIVDFEVYLYATDHVQNTVVAIMKKFRHIMVVAMNKDMIHRDPFKEFKIQWAKVDRGYLT